jgi:hypothetical protein
MLSNATPPTCRQMRDLRKEIKGNLQGTTDLSEGEFVVALSVAALDEYDSDSDFYGCLLNYARDVVMRNRKSASR